jgi:hypothetical protein
MDRRTMQEEPAPRRHDGPARAPDWQGIKGQFVDDPPGALAAAEELVMLAVEERMRQLRESVEELRGHRQRIDPQSTEELRMLLIRYQAYCESLGDDRH